MLRETNRSSLGTRFHALFTGSLVSNIGDGIRLTALPLLVQSLTDSPLLLSAVTAAQYLPWITFAPLGGALVDRWDRRRTILITQAWRGLVVVGLTLLVWTGHAEIWHACVVAFAITVGEILVDPSTFALVPTLVDDADLERANGRIASAEIVANDFAGGPLGAALFGFAPWLPFLIDGVSYLGSVLPFKRLPRSPSQPTAIDANEERSIRAEVREGFDWIRNHDVLGPLTVAQLVYYFGVSANLALLVALVKDDLDGSTSAFGVVIACAAVGAFVGTLVGAPLAARLGVRLSLSGAVALQAVAFGAAATVSSLPALAAFWFLNGVPVGAQRPIAQSLQQRLTPNQLLGRVNVTVRIFTRGIIVIGSLFAGAVATWSGVRTAFALGGVAVFVSAVMLWFALGRLAKD